MRFEKYDTGRFCDELFDENERSCRSAELLLVLREGLGNIFYHWRANPVRGVLLVLLAGDKR